MSRMEDMINTFVGITWPAKNRFPFSSHGSLFRPDFQWRLFPLTIILRHLLHSWLNLFAHQQVNNNTLYSLPICTAKRTAMLSVLESHPARAGQADVLRMSGAERFLVQTASDARKTTLVGLTHVSSSTTPTWQPLRRTAGLAKPSMMGMDYSRKGHGESRHLQHQQHQQAAR